MIVLVWVEAFGWDAQTQVTAMAEWPWQQIGKWSWNVFSVLAGSASIVGLAITVWVLHKVGRIEAGFTQQALLPGYVKKLGGSIKNLKQHQEAKDAEKILSVLTVCQTTLVDLSKHLDAKRAERVSQVVATIEALPPADALSQCGVCISELEAVRETVGNLIKEIQWSGRNG